MPVRTRRVAFERGVESCQSPAVTFAPLELRPCDSELEPSRQILPARIHTWFRSPGHAHFVPACFFVILRGERVAGKSVLTAVAGML